MMSRNLTWGELRAIHVEAAQTGDVRSDDLLADPEFAKLAGPDEVLVYPPEENK
ncbi:hypothetical protein AB4Y72_14985 [Arthrobacter sp. YAF34]|uniref:hypothetical protein n=1 Tax=Arthrobacter sp. YAF34 TaxID=3233083 RepID=UPI003F911CEC